MEPDSEKKHTKLYYTLLDSLTKAYRRFLKIRGNPNEIAFGFALGLFVGMSPFLGLQTAMAIFFAAIFKWNKISAAVGVWISNPVSAPIIYSVTFYIGSYLIGIKGPPNPAEEVGFSILNMLLKTPEIIGAMTIGGIVTGVPVSIIGYYLSFTAVSKYQKGIREKLLKRKQRTENKTRSKRSLKKRKKKKNK